jgi:hypothetical protein
MVGCHMAAGCFSFRSLGPCLCLRRAHVCMAVHWPVDRAAACRWREVTTRARVSPSDWARENWSGPSEDWEGRRDGAGSFLCSVGPGPERRTWELGKGINGVRTWAGQNPKSYDDHDAKTWYRRSFNPETNFEKGIGYWEWSSTRIWDWGLNAATTGPVG